MKIARQLTAALLASLAMASAAQASTTTIGSTTLAANAGSADNLAAQNVPVFQGDASANYVLSSPQNGTITSWSFRSAGIADGRQFVLRVLRPDATGTTWTGIATSAPATVSGGSGPGFDLLQGPFPTSLPIQKGDRIGLQPIDDDNTPIEMGVAGKDGFRTFSNPLPDGSSEGVVPFSTADNGQVVPIQATVQFTPGAPPPPVSAPVNETKPSITGTPTFAHVLTCNPGDWTGAPKFSFAWSQTALKAEIFKKHVIVLHVTTSLGSSPTITVGDLPPGTTTISCAVTATNAAGASTADAPDVSVLPTIPVLVPIRFALRPFHNSAPSITPNVGGGGVNRCTSGTWLHYPTKYTYYWYVSGRGKTKTPPRVRNFVRVSIGTKYTIPPAYEGRTILCGVVASNAAGSSGLALSNRYRVPAGAPINTAAPVVPVAHPGTLAANAFILSCDPGRWNRTDLTFSYQWVFDQDYSYRSPPSTPAPPLTSVTVAGQTLTLAFPGSLRFLRIDGRVPRIGSVTRPSITYLDDDVRCQVTATTRNGASAVAESAPVHMIGPVSKG